MPLIVNWLLIFEFFYIHSILKICSKSTLVHGWIKPKRNFEHRVGGGQYLPFYGRTYFVDSPCKINGRESVPAMQKYIITTVEIPLSSNSG